MADDIGRPLLHEWRALDSICVMDHKTSGVEHRWIWNPLCREFHETPCQYNLIPTSSLPDEKWRHVIFRANSGYPRRFSPFDWLNRLGSSKTSWWGPSSRCSRRIRTLRLCFCSTTCLLVQPPNHCGGRAPRWHTPQPQIPAQIVCPMPCPDCPSGPTGPALPGRHRWCIVDIYGNNSIWISTWGKLGT